MPSVENQLLNVVCIFVGRSPLGAAVAMMKGDGVQGVARMIQVDEDLCVVEGTIDGLLPCQQHKLFVHELGDISEGCQRSESYLSN